MRYPTDVVGDPSIKTYIDQNKEVEKKTKLMLEKKMKVVNRKKVYDESEKIFEKKKGKERQHFVVRNSLPAYSPEKIEAKKPIKSY